MPSFPATVARHSLRAFRITTALRVSSFGVMAGAVTLGMVWHGMTLLHAAAAAFPVMVGLGAGALYSPLMRGLRATLQADGKIVPRPGRGASWAGGVIGACAVILLLWAIGLLSGQTDGAAALLFGFALGLNLAYLPAKAACLVQGCCRAVPYAYGASLLSLPGDLRGAETVLTLVTLAIMAFAPAIGLPAAAPGLVGHALTRLVSVAGRGYGLGLGRLRADPGAELGPLLLLAAASLASG